MRPRSDSRWLPKRRLAHYMRTMSLVRQPSLFDAQARPSLPEGFGYQPEFLSAAEETQLAAWLATLPFQAFQFRGFEGKRRVVSFGWQYDFTRSHLIKADDMPSELLPVRARAAAFADLAPEDLQQCLLNEYLPGAPIGWHRDRPMFEKVVGISLLAPCNFRRCRGARASFQSGNSLGPARAIIFRGARSNLVAAWSSQGRAFLFAHPNRKARHRA